MSPGFRSLRACSIRSSDYCSRRSLPPLRWHSRPSASSPIRCGCALPESDRNHRRSSDAIRGNDMRRLTITAITLAMLVAVPAQATEPVDYQGAAAALAQYKSAMEKRDLTGVEALFSPDAQIFESGGVEGNFAHYRDHHLSSEDRRVGHECVSTCRSRGWPDH